MSRKLKKETLKKESENQKLRRKSKREKLKEKGITLIALVVTIIILLILTGVTLNMTLSDNGLFKKAKEAVDKYEKAQEDDEEAIRQIATQMYNEYVGAIVTGYEPMQGTCKITAEQSGYTAEQSFTTDDKMTWRVWDFDGNILRIVGDPTTSQLTLSGAAGYNNGVWAIDKICKDCYSNGKEGVTVTSLKRSDIQKVSSYDYTQYKHEKDGWEDVIGDSDTEGLIYFGQSKTYPTNNQYPRMWNDNDANWTYVYDKETKTATGGDKESKMWETAGKGEGQIKSGMTQGTKETTFKQSCYYHNYSKNEFPNEKYYDLIFKRTGEGENKRFWLAGRCVLLRNDVCEFGIQNVRGDSDYSIVTSSAMCLSDSTPKTNGRALRPTVSIDLRQSECTITTEIRRRWKYNKM